MHRQFVPCEQLHTRILTACTMMAAWHSSHGLHGTSMPLGYVGVARCQTQIGTRSTAHWATAIIIARSLWRSFAFEHAAAFDAVRLQ